MNRLLVFAIDIIPHLVTTDTKTLGIGHFQARIEPTPENNAQ
jgi:hypothetical protein